jgi:DNA-binding response OmpR family regulator
MNQKRKTKKLPIQLQKVLVVDDDPVIRDMMVDILECEGYVPDLAHNGQEALHALRNQSGYLVFLDLMMPTFSGKDVCTFLAAQAEIRQRHIIVLMSAMDKIEETYGLDVDMVMPKPFLVDDVTEVLDTYMR